MGNFNDYINLTAPLHAATVKGKLGNANEIFLEGDTQNIENEIKGINSRHEELNKKHDTLSSKHESLSRTVQGIAATGGASTATNVTYNNDSSGLNAENAQDAIDKLQDSKVDKTSILQESGNADDKVMSQKAVTDQLSILNVFTLFPFTSGYLKPNGTVIANDNHWITTDFIRIKNDITISANIVEEIKGTAAILFFDANKKVISKVDSTPFDTNRFGFINSANITPPENARYMRCCAPTKAFALALGYNQMPMYVECTGVSTHNIVQESGNADDKVMSQKAVTDQLSILNVFTLFPFTSGYLKPNGTVIANDNHWITTDFIRIKNDITISANIVEEIKGTAAILFFDANKKVISKVDSTPFDTNRFGFINSANITPPENARYMRCCAPTKAFALAVGYNQMPMYVECTGVSTSEEIEPTKEPDIVQTKHVLLNVGPDAKILLYGDSISSTDYNGYKQAMIQHSGLNNVYNAGFSGYTTNALAKDAQLQRIFDYSPDIIIIQCGGNDDGVTVGTFDKNNKSQVLVSETDISKDYSGSYFIQALDHIVRKLKNKYYNLVERANLSGLETSAEKIQKIDAVKQVYIAVITPLPQKRNNAASVWSQEKNWENKRNAVIEVCNKNNIHCIDVYKNWGVDMSKEPFWTSPTDKINQNGIYTMDGLHPSNAGYKKIAELITGEINIKID